jgi:hypothetical protein
MKAKPKSAAAGSIHLGEKPWDIKNIAVWVNHAAKQVFLAPRIVASDDGTPEFWGTPRRHDIPGHWGDPIGANYAQGRT